MKIKIDEGFSIPPCFRERICELQCVYTHVHLPSLTLILHPIFPGCKWISSMTLHPSGDHLLVGTYDRRVIWFDLDLSSMPYKTLKYHARAVRQVAFHPRYPLMASASDDGCIHIIHSMVYNDLLKNPLIVPLKVIHAHKVVESLGVLSLAYHPTQPWVLSSAADGTIRLFQDIH
jgi:ribosome biogenesis protein ERB1